MKLIAFTAAVLIGLIVGNDIVANFFLYKARQENKEAWASGTEIRDYWRGELEACQSNAVVRGYAVNTNGSFQWINK